MKAEELMVGDWVNEIYTGIDKKVYNINKKVSSLDLDNADNFDPIPITEELLEKLGFKKTIEIIYLKKWYNEDGRIQVSNVSYSKDRNWSCHIDNEDMDTIANCDIEYLHQLQQIIRLATGKEMEVNL